MPWTAEELEEMAAADAEIEAHFVLSNEEFTVSRELDRKATLEAMLPEQRKRYESQRRYRAANKEKVAESKQALKAARAAAGLTQAQAAEILGVTQSTISIWENVSSPDNWQEIAETLLSKGKSGPREAPRKTACKKGQ